LKNIYITIAALATILISCEQKEKVINTTTVERDTIVINEADSAATKATDSVDTRKAWEEYATPGLAHKMMAEESGTWTATMTFWEDEKATPQTYAVNAEARMVLSGHYQEVAYDGMMMGMPFQGKSTLAYNNKTGEYTSTWIDNMATGMMVTKGHYDEPVKAIKLSGIVADPITGKDSKVREVYTIVDANTRKLESYDTKEGKKEFKSMEIVLKRKK